MKKTRNVNDPDIYDPIVDMEQEEYSIACVMYACGLDGSSVGEYVIDEIVNSIDNHYWQNNDANNKSEPGMNIPAASTILRRTRSVLLSRLRLSHKHLTIARGIFTNG